MKWVLPFVMRYLAASNELHPFAVAWAVFLGAASELLGFSKEVGAFLAGVSPVSTSYRDLIGSRLTSLRDFLRSSFLSISARA